MVSCPFCHQEALRISMAMTQAEVIKNRLRHLMRAAAPAPWGGGSADGVRAGGAGEEE